MDVPRARQARRHASAMRMPDRVPLLMSVVTRLEGLGIDALAVTRRAGIEDARMRQSHASLSTREFLALWRAIEDLSGDPLIGLRIGGEARNDQLDPGAIAALHSATFGDAVRCLARYKRLCCPEELRIEHDGPDTRVSFHWAFADGATPHALTDAAFAAVHALGRAGTGRSLPPRRIDLSRTLRDTSPYVRHFGCPVSAGGADDVMTYATAAFDERFVTRNTDLLGVLVPALDAQMREMADDGLAQRTRRALERMMGVERPTVEAVAKQIHLSARTFQRRLVEAGTSYQELLNEVRLHTARRLLAETRLDPGEIAFVLGFEEVNSFHRAFRQWEGQTPSEWRRHRAG